MQNVFTAQTTYREDARIRHSLERRLYPIARRDIRFSGTDKDMAEQLWTARVQVADFERRWPYTPEAIRAWAIAETIAAELAVKLDQIRRDAETIGTILESCGYDRRVIRQGGCEHQLFVRHNSYHADVLTDRDPYTQRWEVGFHHVLSSGFDEWCGHVLDAGNTRYARSREALYRVQVMLGSSFHGGCAGLGAGMLLTLPVAALGGPAIAHALILAMTGIGGIGAAAGAYATTKSEQRRYLDACRVSRGRDALRDALG